MALHQQVQRALARTTSSGRMNKGWAEEESIGPVGSRRIDQCIVARPKRSILTETKTKVDRLRARFALVVKLPNRKKRRGQRNYCIPPPSETNFEIEDQDEFIDDVFDDETAAVPPHDLRHKERRWSSFDQWPAERNNRDFSFSSEPWCRSSSRRLRRSTGSFTSRHSRQSSLEDYPHLEKSSSFADNKWDRIRDSIQESHRQPLPYGVVKPSQRSLNRKIQYVKNKWAYSRGDEKRIGHSSSTRKTHYKEPWWRNILRTTINWMCPFVYVGKQGDVYCVESF